MARTKKTKKPSKAELIARVAELEAGSMGRIKKAVNTTKHIAVLMVITLKWSLLLGTLALLAIVNAIIH